MARKSRRSTNITNDGGIEVASPIFKTAIYARLSLEDGGKSSSCSIQNQVQLVRNFIDQAPGLQLAATFVDNGETGMNFDRPAWNDLIAQCRRGRVNCIVVKDLSRLGRNYIETGSYLEKIFPLLETRFISINDNYDSHRTAASRDDLLISLKNLLNDVYAKDISRKVKAAMETKQRRGEFLGSHAAYGYLRCAKDNRRLVINEETAPIVKDIFKWKLAGQGFGAICRRLNSAGVPSPSRYLYLKGMVWHEKFANCIWKPTTIRGILKNPVYTGCMAMGKKKSRIALGLPQICVEPDKWLVLPNTHEPIVDKETFALVGKILKDINAKYHGERGRPPCQTIAQ